MLFLLTAFALESKCKNTNIIQTGKIIYDNSRPFAVIHVEKRPRILRIQRIIRAIRAIRVQKKDGVHPRFTRPRP